MKSRDLTHRSTCHLWWTGQNPEERACAVGSLIADLITVELDVEEIVAHCMRRIFPAPQGLIQAIFRATTRIRLLRPASI